MSGRVYSALVDFDFDKLLPGEERRLAELKAEKEEENGLCA